MVAVVKQGGKQYKVSEGDVINIDLTEIAPDAETITLDKVLCVGEGADIKIGTPYVEGAKVIAKFKTTAGEAVVKGVKLYPSYFRRRKNSRTRVGHRQKYLEAVIEKIEG